MLAGFLSYSLNNHSGSTHSNNQNLGIDPFVANILAQEPVEVQRGVIGILHFLKIITHAGKQ